MSRESNFARHRVGLAVRRKEDQGPARRDYAAARLQDHLAALTELAAPFTEAQITDLSSALRKAGRHE